MKPMPQLFLLAKTLAFQRAKWSVGVAKQRLSMNTRHQVSKGFAKEYAKATKREKGILLDYLWAATGWSSASARRRLSTEYNRNTGKVPTPIPRRRASEDQLAFYAIL